MLDILDLWARSKLKLVYNSIVIDNVTYIKVLDWWFKSKLKMCYSKEVLYLASCCGRIDILN
jgi:hypothetical protein